MSMSNQTHYMQIKCKFHAFSHSLNKNKKLSCRIEGWSSALPCRLWTNVKREGWRQSPVHCHFRGSSYRWQDSQTDHHSLLRLFILLQFSYSICNFSHWPIVHHRHAFIHPTHARSDPVAPSIPLKRTTHVGYCVKDGGGAVGFGSWKVVVGGCDMINLWNSSWAIKSKVSIQSHYPTNRQPLSNGSHVNTFIFYGFSSRGSEKRTVSVRKSPASTPVLLLPLHR